MNLTSQKLNKVKVLPQRTATAAGEYKVTTVPIMEEVMNAPVAPQFEFVYKGMLTASTSHMDIDAYEGDLKTFLQDYIAYCEENYEYEMPYTIIPQRGLSVNGYNSFSKIKQNGDLVSIKIIALDKEYSIDVSSSEIWSSNSIVSGILESAGLSTPTYNFKESDLASFQEYHVPLALAAEHPTIDVSSIRTFILGSGLEEVSPAFLIVDSDVIIGVSSNQDSIIFIDNSFYTESPFPENAEDDLFFKVILNMLPKNSKLVPSGRTEKVTVPNFNVINKEPMQVGVNLGSEPLLKDNEIYMSKGPEKYYRQDTGLNIGGFKVYDLSEHFNGESYYGPISTIDIISKNSIITDFGEYLLANARVIAIDWASFGVNINMYQYNNNTSNDPFQLQNNEDGYTISFRNIFYNERAVIAFIDNAFYLLSNKGTGWTTEQVFLKYLNHTYWDYENCSSLSEFNNHARCEDFIEEWTKSIITMDTINIPVPITFGTGLFLNLSDYVPGKGFCPEGWTPIDTNLTLNEMKIYILPALHNSLYEGIETDSAAPREYSIENILLTDYKHLIDAFWLLKGDEYHSNPYTNNEHNYLDFSYYTNENNAQFQIQHPTLPSGSTIKRVQNWFMHSHDLDYVFIQSHGVLYTYLSKEEIKAILNGDITTLWTGGEEV